MINFLLYTGLGLTTIAVSGLVYGLATTWADRYTIVYDKSVEPQNVKVRQ